MRHGIIKSLAIALLAGFAVSCSKDGGNEPEPQPTYTVTVSATEGGTAATNKNTCPEGEEVTVTATADEGYLFAGWYENEEAVATGPVYSFVMPARNIVLQARFEQETVVPAGNFDHQVTQPAPGGNTSDGGPQAVSNITSVSGVPLVRLNNGVMMPRFGLGTQVQSMEGANQRQQLNETVRGMVISALRSGYRHLDDAMFYYNERGAGWGIKESGIPREEIWVTSKISGDLADAQNAFEGMLKRLQVDYIDLVYIHHPAGTLEDILACWRVMENEYKAGRIRALGISNFDNRMEAFNYVMQNAEIKPQVAQIECHPLAQRKEARQLYADNYDIQVECWYPLNHNRGDVNNAILRQIATAHGKSVYQIILRWHMQEGLCPVPGSTNPDHILENISIFDFELSDEEMSAIRAIDLGDAGRSFNISYGNGNFGNFQDYTFDHTYTPTAIASDYRPDALDQVSANVCTIGMIYAFYGRLSVASSDVEKFRASKIPPTFFAYGTRDPFYRQFQACADAVREAGVEVEEHEYAGMPHGFGYTHEEWMVSFDSWMSKIMAIN